VNHFLIFILSFLIVEFIVENILKYLNIKHLQEKIPEPFHGIYNEEKYTKSQQYLRDNTRISIIQSTLSIVIIISFILLGGFNYIDIFARGFGFGSLITGLIYVATLVLLTSIISMPFSIYDTFVIEEKYGFNNTTVKTFILDLIKGLILSAILGAIVLGAIIWFFESFPTTGWLMAWGGITVFSLFMQFIAPVTIMPLFNKFIPLENDNLNDMITTYANKENFKLQGIFTMDGSKRSSKLNAYFTGFGKFKRIVFFDTLMEKLEDKEIMVVLAHEMGHYKLKHITKSMITSIFVTGAMFFLLSLFMNNSLLFEAFKMENTSVYGSLLFFMMLFSPVNFVLSIITNYISRKHEFQADAYSISNKEEGDAMISALKKLSVENLSNLTPHKAYVFFHFSHPPVLKRIEAIKDHIKN